MTAEAELATLDVASWGAESVRECAARWWRRFFLRGGESCDKSGRRSVCAVGCWKMISRKSGASGV